MADRPEGVCPDQERLFGYLDGVLDDELMEACRRHLLECTHCEEVLREASRLRGVGEELKASPPRRTDQKRVDRWLERTLDQFRKTQDGSGTDQRPTQAR